MRLVVFGFAIGIAMAGFVTAKQNEARGGADTNVRVVQEKLRDAGFYFGEIDGAYSSELAAALGRYQIRNGLPITGQLDEQTSKALGASPAVTTTGNEQTDSSETWRRLRGGQRQTSANAQRAPRRGDSVTAQSGIEVRPGATPAATTARSDTGQPSSLRVTAQDTSSSANRISSERLRDYVGAFVLAGLDRHVGSETEFFADRVQYYDQGVISREKIRKDLERYAAQWPDRRFWIDGQMNVESENGDRVRLTFPLRYDLRNGAKHSSGKINKTLVLQPNGDDLQIVAVNERKAD